MRTLVPCALVLLMLSGLGSQSSLGEQTDVLRKHHPWGTYQPGAWKLVHTVTETFESNKSISSVTDVKTTLEEVGDEGVTLRVEVNIEVGGKRFDAPVEIVKQGFDSELAGPGATMTELGPGEVTIQQRKIACKILQWERTDVTGKTTVKAYYSETVEPYVLRRETVKTDPQGRNRREATYEVIALDVPYRVLGEVINTVQVKTVQKNAEGTTTILARISMDVPGGVICHSLKEVNNQGYLVRRGSLELIDYGLTPEKEPRGLFHHRRPSRIRKPPRSSGYY